MADYIQPDYVEKRLRYFDGQLLKDQDFVDEQKYFIDRQRRYNRFLNVSGIIHGLTLTPATDFVTVAPGAALDNSGRLVVLSDQVIDKDRQVQLGAYRGTTVDLVISYKEDPDPPIGEAPRFREKPQLTVVSSGSGPDGAIALARLTIDQNGGVIVDTKVRVYAGVRFPYDGGGPELRAGRVGRLDVTGDLSVSGNVGIGTTDPGAFRLKVEGGDTSMGGALTIAADKELVFTDNGQIRSLDNNHRILFRRSENILELRELGKIVFSPGATAGNATEKVVMLGNGNVGIGTTDLGSFRLKVEGGDTSLGGALTIGRKDTIAPHMINLFQGAASPDSGFLTFGDGTGWKFHVGKSSDKGATKFLTIQDNGNVGIGTTDLGSFRLKVEGNTSLGGTLTVNGALSLTANNELFFADNGQIRSLDNAHRILFRRAENILELREFGKIVFSPGATAGNATEKVVMLANGNVGIGGTQSPVAKLEVSLASGEDWANANTTGLRLISVDANYYLDVTTKVVTSGNVGYQFRPNGQDGLVITTPGYVGIGTTDPKAKLDVGGFILGYNPLDSNFRDNEGTPSSDSARAKAILAAGKPEGTFMLAGPNKNHVAYFMFYWKAGGKYYRGWLTGEAF